LSGSPYNPADRANALAKAEAYPAMLEFFDSYLKK